MSPYLFLLVMTCVDTDANQFCPELVFNARIPGVQFDTVFYADDTVLFSTQPIALNELLSHMETRSVFYGLKINRNKCHSIQMYHAADVHFYDGTPSNNARDATYLGNTVNIAREVSQRTQDTKRTWLRLENLRKDPNSNPKWKLLIYDAVIKGKLLYCLETVHLTG